MSDELTWEIFNHIVSLAALELDESEAEYLRSQLNNQLRAIHELEAIPLNNAVPPTSHGVPYRPEIKPPLREDQWIPYPHPEDIIAQTPESDDNYIIVPDIPHTELD